MHAAMRPAFATALLAALLGGFVAAPAAAADPPVTLHHSLDLTLVAAACGVVHTERFDLPEGALVLNASMHASLDLGNSTTLGATVEVAAGSFVLASNSTDGGLGWLGPAEALNAGAINAYLFNVSAANGILPLDLTVSICPNLGVAAIRLDEASITYVTAGQNGTGNGSGLPAITEVRIGGLATGTVDAGALVTLAPSFNGTLPGGAQFAWFVDGDLVGNGATLSNYTFAPGAHNVTVRASDGSSVRSFSFVVTARARTAPTNPTGLYVALGALGVVAVGMAVAATDAGRFLLASSSGSVFARLKKASLLDHFVRGTLYQVIREDPGIHFAELRRRANLANGAAAHHLRTLEKGGYIRVVIDGTKTKFYTTDRPLEAEIYGISDTEKAILSAVTDAPGIGQGELAAKLDKSASAISRSVSRLASLGYVTTKHDGAKVLVFPREGADAIDPLAKPWPDEGA